MFSWGLRQFGGQGTWKWRSLFPVRQADFTEASFRDEDARAEVVAGQLRWAAREELLHAQATETRVPWKGGLVASGLEVWLAN